MAASNVSSDEILSYPTRIPSTSEDLSVLVKTENEEKLEIDLSVKCRGCFAEEPEMHYLFTVFDQQLSLADILIQTTSYVCKEDDGFPPYLCTKCTTCLIDFFNFKIQFQKTDIYVHSLLGKNLSPSFEKADVVKSEYSLEEDSLPQVPYDQSDIEEDRENYNNIPVQKEIPDIRSIPGVPGQQCTKCDECFETTDECDTHLARDHGHNPFLKYKLFRQMVVLTEKALAEEKKKQRFLAAELEEEVLMNLPGKLCRICRKKFPEEQFQAHWDMHKIHVCELCGHKCVKKSDMDVHKLCVHSDVRNFKCTMCEKSFKTKQFLKRHEVTHWNLRSYCCDVCGQRFNDGGTLKTHFQLKHIGNRDFICPICGLAFPMKATLDKHIVRHNKNRPPSFHCTICSSAFRDKSSLKRHHLVKHTNEFIRPVCEHCGKSYCSISKLKYHIERHHSGKQIEWKKRGPKRAKVESENSQSDPSDSEEESSGSDRPKQNDIKYPYRSSGFTSHQAEENSEGFYKEENDSEDSYESDTESE